MKKASIMVVIGVALCGGGFRGAYAANTRSLALVRASSQSASIADASHTGLDLSGDFTIEFWIKLNTRPPNDRQVGLVQKWDDQSSKKGYQILFYHYGFTNPEQYRLQTIIAQNANGSIQDDRYWDGTAPEGVWLHLAVTCDIGNPTATQFEYYLNGILRYGDSQSTGDCSSIYNNDTSFIIGAMEMLGVKANFYDGLIDDVRVWNTVRTQEQITANKNVELAGTEAGLVAYWKFNNSALDETANNNDLTLNNSPSYSTDVPLFNQPPGAFSLASPSEPTSTNDNTPTFSWGASTDPESQPVTYTLKLSTTAGFTEPVYRTVSSLTTTPYTAVTEIADGSYYWKVIASDGVLQTESTQTWQLTVDTQRPVTPVIRSMYPDFATGKITKIYGTGETGTTLTLYDKNGGTLSGTTDWAGGNFTFIPTTPLDPGTSVYVKSGDAAANTSDQSKTVVPVFGAYYDIFKDIAVYHGTGPGDSMRLEKDTSYEFDIAVNAGSPVTVRAWLMYNSEYDGSAADAPRLTLSGLGITAGNTAAMTAPASYTPDTWEQLTVSGTPNAKGVVTLKVETFSTATEASAWIDDITVTP